MNRLIPVVLLVFSGLVRTEAQITSPVIRGNFGVDADLRANYFNGSLSAGNDDWFNLPGTAGIGAFVIDTSGAAAIVARYATDIPFRRTTFARSMRYPAYSIVNNRTLLDAIMVRDFHGDDSTVFASGSNKNGDNPLDWSTPVSQGIPDKNDILDMFVHARRAGPNGTDSLWLFGGLSLDNTTGNRYFDLEMFQTDFYYDRPNLRFGGAGPDEGHTSWEFDAAGNITRAGDIIFSAEYQSSSLTNIEARIWIPRTLLSITPLAFNWGGAFDGATNGSLYGYASIQPKNPGAYYTGLQCSNNTWGGPFSIVLQNDALTTVYSARQFVEFSVNLTKLGLDPLTRLGGDPCGMPFRRVTAKTRASASFTAELKDFVAPFNFFFVPMAEIETETPMICNQGSIAEIHVSNPMSTSTYTWSTINGNIISGTSGESIYVDAPGTYIVTQYLLAGCGAYKVDSIEIQAMPVCDVLAPSNIYDLRGTLSNQSVHLSWKVFNDQPLSRFEIQRSSDGVHFSAIGTIVNEGKTAGNPYQYTDMVSTVIGSNVYYRIMRTSFDGRVVFSDNIRIPLNMSPGTVRIFPNPVKEQLYLQVFVENGSLVKVELYEPSGRLIDSRNHSVRKGNNVLAISDLSGKPGGIYIAMIRVGDRVFSEKVALTR